MWSGTRNFTHRWLPTSNFNKNSLFQVNSSLSYSPTSYFLYTETWSWSDCQTDWFQKIIRKCWSVILGRLITHSNNICFGLIVFGYRNRFSLLILWNLNAWLAMDSFSWFSSLKKKPSGIGYLFKCIKMTCFYVYPTIDLLCLCGSDLSGTKGEGGMTTAALLLNLFGAGRADVVTLTA